MCLACRSVFFGWKGICQTWYENLCKNPACCDPFSKDAFQVVGAVIGWLHKCQIDKGNLQTLPEAAISLGNSIVTMGNIAIH